MIRLLVAFVLLLSISFPALSTVRVPPPSDLSARNFALMDTATGRLLAQRNADERVEPASLTKIMTAYVVFREIRDGKLTLDEQVRVSEAAWRTGMSGASRMFIEVNTLVSVEDLLRGMIVQSGNDACVALAERVSGTEGAFVDLMNATARTLGMNDTQFQNSHGLPSEQPQYTSARDISVLLHALIRDFPDLYRYYSERSFSYNGIDQSNRNLLLWRDDSVDGGKTGWTSTAGYNLVTSARRGDMRLVAAVMGISASNHQEGGRLRANESQALYNWAFREFETVKLYGAGQVLTDARVWKGESSTVPLGLTEDLYVTIPRGSYESLVPEILLSGTLHAPLRQGETQGELNVRFKDETEVIAAKPLVVLETVEEAGGIRRAIDSLRLMLK